MGRRNGTACEGIYAATCLKVSSTFQQRTQQELQEDGKVYFLPLVFTGLTCFPLTLQFNYCAVYQQWKEDGSINMKTKVSSFLTCSALMWNISSIQCHLVSRMAEREVFVLRALPPHQAFQGGLALCHVDVVPWTECPCWRTFPFIWKGSTSHPLKLVCDHSQNMAHGDLCFKSPILDLH